VNVKAGTILSLTTLRKFPSSQRKSNGQGQVCFGSHHPAFIETLIFARHWGFSGRKDPTIPHLQEICNLEQLLKLNTKTCGLFAFGRQKAGKGGEAKTFVSFSVFIPP